MEFTLVLVIFLLVAVIAILLTFKSQAKQNSILLNKHIVAVYKRVKALEEKLENGELKTSAELKKPEETAEKQTIVETKKEEIKPKPVINPTPKKEEIIVEEKVKEVIQPVVSTAPAYKEPVKKTQEVKTSKPKRDYEKQIGENLLNKIGIAVLVIGIGFFVKFAIDREWIGEIGRVAIGIGVGSILIGIAHFIRKNYNAFSSVLIGGGIAVFYYTISIAYHYYDIFSQPIAFTIMTLITILSVVLSLIYDKKEIAIIGILGGFTSPFMVAGETENYVAFFTYIAILNSGMLALSFFKKWNIINKLAYGFTILFFGTWTIIHIADNDLPKKFALIMASVFYVQFLVVSLWYNIAHNLKFKALEFIQVLSINALYFLAGVFILMNYKNGDYQGLFALILAILNGGVYYLIKSIKSTDVNLPPLFIGKTVSFVTLAILLQFDAHYATMFWAVEAVIVLWIGQKSKQQILKHASVLINLIASFGLVYSWFKQYADFNHVVLFDSALVSNLGIVLTLTLSVFLLNKEEEDSDFFSVPANLYKNTVAFWAYLAFYVTVLIKLLIMFDSKSFTIYADSDIEYIQLKEINAFKYLIIWTYHIIMVGIGLAFCKIKKINMFTELFFGLSVLSILGYLLIGNLNTITLRQMVLNNQLNLGYFVFHFVVVATIIGSFFFIRKSAFQITNDAGFHKWILVVLSVFGVTMASMELDHLAVSLFYNSGYGVNNILVHTQREGYSTLWGVYSFVLMIYGMRKKNAHMRILALVLFGLTLLKLFILDIKGMSDAGKIIAFISLGVLLLVVSFLYQKLRKIIVEGEIK